MIKSPVSAKTMERSRDAMFISPQIAAVMRKIAKATSGPKNVTIVTFILLSIAAKTIKKEIKIGHSATVQRKSPALRALSAGHLNYSFNLSPKGDTLLEIRGEKLEQRK